MNLMPVMYHLKVGDKIFLKHIYIRFIPVVGSYLKVVNSSFIVTEFEQDLDAYSDKHYEHGISCESVRAELNMQCHSPDDYYNIIVALKKDDWAEGRIV